jgi:hypothetical protein
MSALSGFKHQKEKRNMDFDVSIKETLRDPGMSRKWP